MTGIVVQLVFVALALVVLALITIDDRRSRRIRREAEGRKDSTGHGYEGQAGDAAEKGPGGP